MANPFDQFDSPSANPFDQFDQGQPPQEVAKDDPSMLEFLLGAPRKGFAQQPVAGAMRSGIGAEEQAAKVGTGFVAPATALAPAVLKSLNQTTSGTPSEKDTEGRSGFARAYSEAIDRLTYQPQTQRGEDFNQPVDEAINRYLIPLLGHGPAIEGASLTRRMAKEAAARVEGGSIADRIKAKQGELDAARTTVNPFDQFDQKFADQQDAGIVARLQGLDKELSAKEDAATAQRGVDAQVANLHDRDIEQRLRELDQEQNLRQNFTDIRQEDAQASIEARQKALEEDVARQGGLDYNAAERGRQEAASLPAEPIDAAAKAADVPKATKDWYDLMLERARQDEPKAGTPAFMEPDSRFPNVPFNFKKQGGGILFDFGKEKSSREATFEREQARSGDTADFWRERYPTSWKVGDIADYNGRRVEILENNGSSRVTFRDTTSGKTYFGEPASSVKSFGIKRGQRGAINPDVFREGFEKLKQLADGTTLRAFSHGDSLTIEALRSGQKIGGALYEKTDKYAAPSQTDLAATMVGSKQRGLATQVYKFASELGNDVVPSRIQTPAGRAMWEGFNKNGVATNGVIRSPGNKQRGAVLIGERPRTMLDQIAPNDKPMIPDDPKWSEVKEAALAGKDNKQWNYTESGSTLTWMKRASVAVQAASRMIQNAVKRADLAIRKNVFPVEKALRKLGRDELVSLGEVLKQEMFRGERFSHEALLEGGMSSKQLTAYAHMREMFEDTLRIQNEARAAKGQNPITAQEAYLSSRWDGDFRRPIYQAILDKENNPIFDERGNPKKKLVWYLAANTKMGLERQSKALQAKFPDLEFDPKNDHVVRYYKRQTDLQSSYTTILDILGRDDPAVQRIQDYIKDQATNEAASFLNQEKHFREKANIHGFVGDRPGQEGKPSEALAMFQQQIQYAKNAYKWSELQKAGEGIKEIVSDPDLQQQQPNNIKYIREYYKNTIGYGEARAISHLEDAVRDLGFSPTIANDVIGGMKSFFILQKLAVSVGFTITQGLQFANSFSHLADLYAKGYKGNPITSMAVGLSGGIAMASQHYLQAMGVRPTRLFADLPESAFVNRAFKYAEDNGVISRSIYDESPIENSFSKLGLAANIAGKTLSVSEAYLRATTFMTFVNMLKESGKLKSDMDIFQMADERTNAAMVDYRTGEKPMMFSKLGTIGTTLNTLQTYPMNWYNQWNYFGREAVKGNVAPFIAAFAAQYALAGAMGIPGFADMDKLYMFIKDHVPTKYWLKAQDSDFFRDPKVWMMKNFGQAAIYGTLSDKTNLGLTSRITAPAGSEMIQAPGGPIVDIAKQGIAAAQAVADPTNTTKLANVAAKSTPPGLWGALETSPMMEGKTYETRQMQDGTKQYVAQAPGDLTNHRGVYARTEAEQGLRKFGLRSQNETVGRELGYRMQKDIDQGTQRANALVTDFYDAVKRGNKAAAVELNQMHVKITGKPISDPAIEKQILESYTTNLERAGIAHKTISSIQGYARTQKLLQDIREGK